jgi:hyperosmotically inducible protein
MRYALRSVSVLALLAFVLVGCAATSGSKTAGESIDDASITAAVKTKLAGEKVSTLTKIDVDTNRGTVYLTGNVDDEAMRVKAASLARQVKGVREVVNNLKVKGS